MSKSIPKISQINPLPLEIQEFDNQNILENYQYIISQNDMLLQDREDREQIRNQRKIYAIWIFIILSGWLLSIIVITIFCGLKIFHLNDNVLITIFGTTTINILGLSYIVANYLFPKSKLNDTLNKKSIKKDNRNKT
jgi:hypothetical protein